MAVPPSDTGSFRLLAAFVLAGAFLLDCGGNDAHPASQGLATPSPLTLLFTSPPAGAWVAIQEEDGPWTPLAASSSGPYSYTLADRSHRFGLVYAVSDSASDSSWVQLTQSTGTEWLQGQEQDPGPAYTSQVQMLGGITGLGATEQAQATLGNAAITATAATARSLSFTLYAPDTADYLIGKLDPLVSPLYNKVFIQRGIPITAQGPFTLPTVDLASQGFTPGVAQLGVNGSLPGETVLGAVSFATLKGYLEPNPVTLVPGGGLLSFTYNTLPPGYTLATDSYLFQASAWTADLSNPSYSRAVSIRDSDGGARTLDLPPQLTGAYAMVGATSPFVRLQFHWPDNLGPDSLLLTFDQTTHWDIFLSPGWLKGASSYMVPDLSGVSNWQAGWGLTKGTPVQYSILATGITNGLGQSISRQAGYGDQITP